MPPSFPPSHFLSPVERLAAARLYVLIDAVDFCSDRSAPRLFAMVESLIAANVGLIQLRDKGLSDQELVSVGERISRRTASSPTLFVMNDRPDLAVAARADGVHLGQDDASVTEARLSFGRELSLFGVSTHSIEQAKAAVDEGADYIGVGPVFPSRTKAFRSHVGLGLVRQIATEIDLPAFAIGGIDLQNVGQVVEAGLSRVAVSAAVARAEDPRDAALDFIKRLAGGP